MVNELKESMRSSIATKYNTTKSRPLLYGKAVGSFMLKLETGSQAQELW